MKMGNMSTMIKIVEVVLIIVALAVIMYGIYWVIKNVSYTVFYKDMVIETIQETVKQSSLK